MVDGVDQVVRLESIPGTGSLPGGLSLNTDYYVISAATDDFQLSTTLGGTAVNITTIGRCLVMPYTPLVVTQNDAPQFPSGAIKITED